MTPNEAKLRNIYASWNQRCRQAQEKNQPVERFAAIAKAWAPVDIMAPASQYQNAVNPALLPGYSSEAICNAYRRAALGWWLPPEPTPIAEAVGRFYTALEGGQVSAPASQGGGVQASPAGAKPIPAQALKGWAQGRYLDSARMGWVR